MIFKYTIKLWVRLLKCLGIATQRDFKMLRDDLRNELVGLAADVSALEVRLNDALANAFANTVEAMDVQAVVDLRGRVNAVLAPVVEPPVE